MKAKAAVEFDPGKLFEIEKIDLGGHAQATRQSGGSELRIS